MKRVAAYVRVSTDEQAEKGNSIPEQKERLQAYCKAMGWGKPKFFIDDGESAKDMKRPDIQKLIAEVKLKEFDIVLTSKLDRMSRNLLDMLQFIKMLDEYECGYVSATESFDTSTAVGRMVLQLLAVFAEFERERISERVKDNMISLARNTDKALTQACFGLDVIGGKFEINKEESPIVELMADLIELQYQGYRLVAKTLNEKGFTTKKGKPWDQINVKRVIRNPAISGTMVYNMRKIKNGKTVIRDKDEWIIKENNHPAIISPERQQKILNILDSRKPSNKHADSESYILTGLVKCGHCGKGMKGSTARHQRGETRYEYYKYICSSYTLGYGCKHHSVHRDDLETRIVSEINRIIETDPSDLKLIISASPSNTNETEEIKAQLSKVNKRIQKQIEAYENELISAADLKMASERAEKERTELNRKLENEVNRKADVKDVQKTATQLIGDICGVDRIKAKAAIRQIIEKIEITDGELIKIVWRPLI